MNWPPNDPCDPIWEHADWLPVWYLLDRWCRQDARCRQAKQQALLSACERGEIDYRRSDGKTFDDPVYDLHERGILLISRASFDVWVMRIEGKTPLSSVPTPSPSPLPSRPAWADESWQPPTPQVVQTTPTPVETPRSDDDDSGDDQNKISPADAKADYATYPPEAELRKLGVPTDEIIAAFPVEPVRLDNEKWWKERMGNVSRANKALGAALVQKGLQNRGSERFPSWWRPDLVARWLIDAGHMSVIRVAPILRKEFPAWAKHFDAE